MCAQHPMCAQHLPVAAGLFVVLGPHMGMSWGMWGCKAEMLLFCPSLTLLCLSFPCALWVACALPGLLLFGFAKGPVRAVVELNPFLIPSWGGGGICSPLLADECPWSPSFQVQGVPRGAVAAVALPPAALLGFLLAASPEHRLPPPHPCPGAAAAAVCGITQGLSLSREGETLSLHHCSFLTL